MKQQNDKIDIVDIIETYKPDNSLFSTEESDVNFAKNVIYSKLNEADRRIFLLYVELGNIRATAEVLKVSTSTVYYKIKEIKKKICKYFNARIDF